MNPHRTMALRLVLLFAGLFAAFTGINVGFGGIPTLGWEGSNDFLTITDERAYAIQDSHTRFLGGFWFAVGMLFIVAASTSVVPYAQSLRFATLGVFIGGLMRFTQLDPGVTLGIPVVFALIAELLIMPILFLWIGAQTRRSVPQGK